MRGSLGIHSLMGLALFIGWSLLADARERVAPTRLATTTKSTPQPPARPSHVPAVDPKLWN
jgi:hypothetical protein